MGGGRCLVWAIAVVIATAVPASAQPTPDEDDPAAERKANAKSKPVPDLTPAHAVSDDGNLYKESSARPGGRPYFLKGELTNLDAATPNIPDRFIGLSAGLAALPDDLEGVLNTLYLSLEPQIDVKLPRLSDLQMSFGLPLRFEIARFRASFGRCLDVGLDARAAGASQSEIAAATGNCIVEQNDLAARAGDWAFGSLRKLDWDELSDFAKVIRYIRYGGDEQKLNLHVGPSKSQTLGHGTVIRRYNPNVDFNTTRVGITFDAYHGYAGFESVVNDILDPDVAGLLAFIRPLEPHFPNNIFLSRLSFGANVVVGRNVPGRVRYQPGLFAPSEGLAVPALDGERHVVTDGDELVGIVGVDAEAKLLRTNNADLKVYLDLQKMISRGKGYTAGGLIRLSFGRPASTAVRIRGELQYFEPDYMPSFFDSFYDVHKAQFMRAGYRSGDGLPYFPTKLAYLDANAGGKHRLGAYLSAAFTLIGRISMGVTARGSVAVGAPAVAGFTGPQFPDYAGCSFAAADSLDCAGAPMITVNNAGYASLRVHAEVPFNKYVQGFAIYEVSSYSLDAEGLDLLNFDADNELFLSAFRLRPVPWLWLQGEVYRNFFVPRIANVDVDAMTLEQDQNYRTAWTFAFNLYVGHTY